MTNFQKVCSAALSLCFLVVLAVMPGPFFLRENVYRQLPLYCFLEKKAARVPFYEDRETYDRIVEANAAYLSARILDEQQKQEEQTLREKPEKKNNRQEGADAVNETNGSTEAGGQDADRVKLTPDAAWVQATPGAVKGTAHTKKKLPALRKKEVRETAARPHPRMDLSPAKLADTVYLQNNFFIVDEETDAAAGQLNAADFLQKDMTLKQSPSEPQILIYHTHASETFLDSREGMEEDTIVGVGEYLTEVLTETYGYNVFHIKEAFDMKEGYLDRSAAYDYARACLEPFLKEHPSIEVIIDLHRDGVPAERHLVTEIGGKPTAQIMFYNGLSYTVNKGKLDYLPNSYIQDNLAFSFQMEYEMAKFYPDFYRGIYLAGYRYNLHLRPKSMLLEAGAQTNTVQEVKNAMEPFADILNRVLKGGDK